MSVFARLGELFRYTTYHLREKKYRRACGGQEFHGTEYGGWMICPELIRGKEAIVYAFGIGEDISFDLSLIASYSTEVYAFDPTPRSIAWVKLQTLPSQFHLLEYGIASYDGVATFYPPEEPAHVSHTMLVRSATASEAIQVPVHRLQTILGALGHKEIDILKMDIEGAEYEVIPDIIQSRIFPKQILVEFHHRFDGIGCEKTRACVDDLLRAGYRIFSVSRSGNDYCFILGDAT